MANAAQRKASLAVRGMIAGEPGTGKTGALVPLLNAGFKLRILDYDHNLDPIFAFADPAKLVNMDYIKLEDKLRTVGGFMEPAGIPTAFADGLRAMDRWRYYKDTGALVGPKADETREIVDLGASDDWGLDTVVVLDGLTTQGQAAFNRALKLLNRTPANVTQQVWQLAMSEQLKFLKALKTGNFHLLVLCHTRIISPKDVQKDDSDITKEIKERLVEIVQTKVFPRALGYELPQYIAGEFPLLIRAENKVLPGGKVKRILRTQPDGVMDLKVPAEVPAELPIETGLLDIFKAISPESVAAVMGKNVP